MIRSVVLLMLLTSFSFREAHAQIGIREICEQHEKYVESLEWLDSISTFQKLGTFMRLTFSKKSLFVVQKMIPLDGEPANKLGAEVKGEGESFVFSIRPLKYDRQKQKDFDALEREYLEVQDGVFKRRAELTKILNGIHEVSVCETALSQSSFQVDAYVRDFDRYFELKNQVDFRKENEKAAAIVERYFAKRSGWIVRPSTEMQELFHALQSHHAKNLVLVMHAASSGQLVDAKGDPLPSTFFEGIPESLRTLTIFSCHSEAVAKYYRLDKLVARGITVAQSSIQSRARWLLGDTVPIQFFPAFMNRLQQEVLKNAPEQREAFQDKGMLTIRGWKVKSGQVGVFMNQSLVAILDSTSSLNVEVASKFILPKNVLILKSLTFSEPTQIEASASAELEYRDSTRTIQTKIETFSDEDRWIGSRSDF